MKKKGRPPGSKNKPTLIKVKRTKLDSLKLSRECLRIVHARAEGSGLSPQTVLEDLIMAGDYTMGQAYDNLSNFRKRIRQKASERNNVVPITSVEAAGQNGYVGTEQGDEAVDTSPGDVHVPEGQGEVQQRSYDAAGERGHRPEDNPSLGDPSAIGNVIGVQLDPSHFSVPPQPPSEWENFDFGNPDQGPILTDEEGNPIEPQEVHEELE